LTICVDQSDENRRLDQVLADRLKHNSRSAAARLIRKGHVRVEGLPAKPAFRVRCGQIITVTLPAPEPCHISAEPITLNILYEDDDIVVINKAPGQVVHPAPGNLSGTLVNALLYRYAGQMSVGGTLRPGIVHRLDKETSGALVVARNDRAHELLSAQFKARRVAKTYLALVHGSPAAAAGRIDLSIGRHPIHRKRMSTRSRHGRPALSLWQVRTRFDKSTLLSVDLKTGRTHQIRVHLSAIGHPIVGDMVYGGRRARDPLRIGQSERIAPPRQMLHAQRLAFKHPAHECWMIFKAPVAEDMAEVIDRLAHGDGAGVRS
jgi:23S rRNA pseudouridine1911/1915/1917 synthase